MYKRIACVRVCTCTCAHIMCRCERQGSCLYAASPRCFDFAQHDKEEWMLLRIVILNVVKNLADRRNKLLQKSLQRLKTASVSEPPSR